MAVRGLGCPVRFTLTAGQKGDAPQAAPLSAGLPAEVVMADTAYDADHLRQAIAAKGALAVIPNNPSRALKYPLDKHLYAQRHLVECCFLSSSSSAASQPASKDRPKLSYRRHSRCHRLMDAISATPPRALRSGTGYGGANISCSVRSGARAVTGIFGTVGDPPFGVAVLSIQLQEAAGWQG
jgi:transposase